MPRSMPELLAEAVRLARENAAAGQGPFGALVVRDGEVLGAGVNTALRDCRRVAGPVRLALEVDDSAQIAAELVAGGADELAPATETPWGDLNARVRAPDGMQLTLFTVVGD